MVAGQVHVFIHVEGYDVAEGDGVGFVGGDEVGVDSFGGGAGWEAEDEGFAWGWAEGVDAVLGVVSEE